MSDETDVLVIGGGVIGVCAAYYLAKRGRQVTVLDRGEVGGRCSSSHGNPGLLVPTRCIPLAAPGAAKQGLLWMLDKDSPFWIKPRFSVELISWLVRFWLAGNQRQMRKATPVLRALSVASMNLYDELAALEGLDFHYQRKGLLLVYGSEAAYRAGIKEARFLSELGVDSRVLTVEQAREMEPSLAGMTVGGIYCQEDANISPAAFVRGLASKAEQLGAVIRNETEVLTFETSARRISLVKTTQSDFLPHEVVLAAGSWSPGLARELGIRLPIQPAKGYSITVKRPAVCPAVPLILEEAKVAVGFIDNGQLLRFSGTLELAGLDMSITRRRVDAIMRAVHKYVPTIGELEVVEIWRGLRPCTPDGVPVIGRPQGYDNLIIATGHAMKGMTLGPITGKVVSELASN